MLVARRPASVQDAAFARPVHHRAYREVSVRQFGQWDEEAQDKYFADGWAAATHEILSCDGVPCGYIHIENRDSDILIHELVVDPEFQGNGIGSHILRETMGIARARSIPIHLRVLRLNRAANLYRRLGFREIGTTDTHVEMEWRSL